MRSWLLPASLVALIASTDAEAFEVVFSLKALMSSSESFEATRRADEERELDEKRAAARAKRDQERPPAPAPPPSAPAVAVQPCSAAQACGEHQQCLAGQCVTSPPAPPAAVPCRDASTCASGEQCFEGQCVRPSSVREQHLELQLRAHAAALREELALGEGPLLDALAAHEGVDARTLGRVARAHRAELVALMQRDRGWPRRLRAWVLEAKQSSAVSLAARR